MTKTLELLAIVLPQDLASLIESYFSLESAAEAALTGHYEIAMQNSVDAIIPATQGGYIAILGTALLGGRWSIWHISKAIRMAIRSCNLECLHLLLEYSNHESRYEGLLEAISQNNRQVIALITKQMVFKQSTLDSLMAEACMHSSMDVIETFISLGAHNFDRGFAAACRHKNQAAMQKMASHDLRWYRCRACNRPITHHGVEIQMTAQDVLRQLRNMFG